ncbi:CUB and sushi domain-containing protein 1 [Exaiptasia diaphana]|nr:CUB and sushi domain-containing protein 1 [Exaiptasia diaphana]
MASSNITSTCFSALNFNFTTAQCPDPGIQKNGYRTGISFLDNMAVQFDCKENFDIIGSPTCQGKSCGRPKTPVDGSMVANNGYSYTAHIVFKCQKGYQMIGSATSVCLDNGTWSSPPPSCSVHLFMPSVGR